MTYGALGPAPTTKMDLPPEMTLSGFSDTTLHNGFDTSHPYNEWVWLPVIGPSSLWMWRRLVHYLPPIGPEPVQVPTTELVDALGLGASRGATGVGARTVHRLARFDFLQRTGRDGAILVVRRAAGPVPAYLLDRLPDGARRYHDGVTAGKRFW